MESAKSRPPSFFISSLASFRISLGRQSSAFSSIPSPRTLPLVHPGRALATWRPRTTTPRLQLLSKPPARPSSSTGDELLPRILSRDLPLPTTHGASRAKTAPPCQAALRSRFLQSPRAPWLSSAVDQPSADVAADVSSSETNFSDRPTDRTSPDVPANLRSGEVFNRSAGGARS
ncbi:hypothetical protein KFL_011320030 [Klebsormidium nitens]|uniref:Uncharacterized protein n=1 Tax=Klebsormidium nitens TaxID=105231 RepID=A0A1Y1IVP7_KLENI|nr:hypothetical protein KFL_011320030 [Klebsormidium nitens]|eukprot:GAQ92777.1 hypothetical protein KFL_011320030 [Klebsormidium nitens]